MGGTKGGGSTNSQQPQSMGQMGSSDLGLMTRFMSSQGRGIGRSFAGNGSKGAMPMPMGTPPEQVVSLSPAPDYVNYQQMPVYSSQTVMPSQAITNFTSGYANGGAAKERGPDDEIEAALRIVRLLGELKKKL